MDTALQKFTHIINQQHGLVDRYLGDGLMALFGMTVANEDDAERAVRAGLEIVATAQTYADEIQTRWQLPDFQVRVGINTGLVAIGGATEANYTAIGTAVNLAARMEAAAPANGVLITHNTYLHVRGLFDCQPQKPIQVKGSSDLLQTYIVGAVRPRAFHVHTRGIEGMETRLIGRDDELQTLQMGWTTAVTDHTFQAITILGDAGVGKSRLLEEFERWSDDQPAIKAFKGRATLEIQRLPFGLIRDLFALQFDIQESDLAAIMRQKFVAGITAVLRDETGERAAHFIGQLLGFDFRDSPHLRSLLTAGQPDARQLRDRAGRYLQAFFAAQTAPTLILLEDIHWADSSSLDLIGELAGTMAQRPLLLVCLARPLLVEQRPLWGESFPVHDIIRLTPLSAQDSQHLVVEILQKVQKIPPDLLDLIVNKAEGNPFYLEEIIKMLIEDGVIVKGRPFWWIEPDRLNSNRIPTTLTGVLQASLDRLSDEERMILQQASVVGRTFWDAVVARINRKVNEAVTDDEVQMVLSALRGKEMIYRRPYSSFARAQELMFKHAILREVTYESVLKRVRRTYHALVADWLLENSTERSSEYTGLIAEHLERAGDTDRAVTYLKQAGEQAAARYANAEAIDYFSRALVLTTAVAPRYDLLLAREKVYDLCGQRDPQADDLDELEQLADQLDELAQAQVALRRANYAGILNDYAATIEAAQLAIGSAQAAMTSGVESMGIQAAGYLQWGWALRRQGEIESAQLQMTQALELAQLAGLRQVEADCLRSLGVAFDKHGDAERAQTYYEQALTLYQAIGNRRGEGRALNGLGNLANSRRDFAQAQTYYQQNLAICREIGDRSGEGWALWWLGSFCSQMWDNDGARHYYRQALQVRREIGDHSGVAMTLTNLGRMAQFQHDYGTARNYCDEALRIYEKIGDQNGVSWAYWWLAGICYEQADYATARSYYRQVLALRRDLGEEEGLGIVLSRLGQLCLDTAVADQARIYFEESLQLSQKLGKRWDEAYALNNIGNALLDAGDVVGAKPFFEQALQLRQTISGPPYLVVEPMAGLTAVALAEGDLTTAQTYADEIWTFLQRRSLRGVGDLFRVYVICLQVMKAMDDGRYDDLCQQAYDKLQARATHIPNDTWRNTFWSVPAHTTIRKWQSTI